MNTIQTVYEMIGRNFGEKAKEWFVLSVVPEEGDKDWFRIKEQDNRILVEANNGSALARGVYEYLKSDCHVQLTQMACNTMLPEEIVLPVQEIYRETKMKQRFAYNYCTHSYTMAFWGEEEWQKELDVLAFHGVNLILDITGEEMVWFRFFQKIGYEREEARKMLVGPAYWAWFGMANMYSYDGNLPDEYLERRVALAKKNHAFMKSLGISPVLMGYCGMVPENIQTIDSRAQIIPQGHWNYFPRPAMLETDSDSYRKYAALFYETQREVLGDITDFYSVDPFHEGGMRGTLSDYTVAKYTLEAMKKENPNCVWIIQSWGGNPTEEQLEALRDEKEHVLVLDLYAEKTPRFKQFRGKEFRSTPWIYCMLNNFGGRLGLTGHLDNMERDIFDAMAHADCMKGVGITPEASNTNALLTEYLFDSIWQDREAVKPERTAWLSDYLYARYGVRSSAAEQCFRILCDSVFCSSCNMLGEGAPESIINARPDFEIAKVSEWGNARIGYDSQLPERALELLLQEEDLLKEKETYIQDVTDIRKQILSNRAIKILEKMTDAYRNGSLEAFTGYSDEFLALILETDSVLAAVPEYTLENWLHMAQKASAGLDEEVRTLFIRDAKKLITTWGDEDQSEKGCLHDYSNRQWSGITRTLYYDRWKCWIENRKRQLRGEQPEAEDFYQMDRAWVDADYE